MTMLDPKGREPLAAEFDRLVREYREPYPESTRQEAWNLIADFAVENADTISRTLSTITPAEVGWLVDAQTEARAIVSAALPPHEQAMLGGDAVVVLADLIANALAAKDAELAALQASWRKLDDMANEWADRAHQAEAQLAEARKALDALGAFAFWFQKYPEFKPNPDMQAEMLADLDRARPFIPARRALTGGKEDG